MSLAPVSHRKAHTLRSDALMSQIDDFSLISLFIEGRNILVSNHRLRIQPVQDVVQLLTHRGQIIAIAYPNKTPATLIVRAESNYVKVLHKLLLDSQFMRLGRDTNSQFLAYEYHPIPSGHDLRDTTAVALWKYWWNNRRRFKATTSPEELLVFTQGHWLPIKDIACNQGTMFISTVLGELPLQGNDEVVWLEKQQELEEEEDKTVFFVGSVPASAHQLSQRVVSQPVFAPVTPSEASQASVPSGTKGLAVAIPTVAATLSIPMLAANLQNLVEIINDKLLIHTALGNIVVEGRDIRCYLATAPL